MEEKIDKIIFNIKTSEGDFFTKTLNPFNCGSTFFNFPGKAYEENTQFTNNLVLGSGGTFASQIILRAELRGDKFNPQPHLHIDEGYLKQNKEVRTRRTLEHWKMPKWVEIEMIEGENKNFKKINLISLK